MKCLPIMALPRVPVREGVIDNGKREVSRSTARNVCYRSREDQVVQRSIIQQVHH